MELPAQFGKYRLLHRVGHGGMAELYLAMQTGLKGFEKVLAIKKILPHLTQDPEFVSMFVNEGKLAALLSHQHIAQIFDLDHVDGVYYIAMEYVMGKDLRTVAKRARDRGGRLSLELALLICSDVASGLDYAHRRKDLNGRDLGIVHRDVSPQNILVSYEGEVKLVDFGIAKVAGLGQETKTGILKGKLAYMSPEQAMGRPIDRRSDIFALGIVLYEVLTGRRLFKGDSDLSTLEQVRTANVQPPSQLDDSISPELEAVVMKALAREADQRYQTSAEFQAALEGVLSSRGGASTMQLSQIMMSLFSDDQRVDTERLQSIHQEPIKPANPPSATVTVVSAPPIAATVPAPAAMERRQTGPRRPIPREQPVPEPKRSIGPTLVLSGMLVILGSAGVFGTPAFLLWMRDQPPEVARAGAFIETQLAAMGLSMLIPQADARHASSAQAQGDRSEPQRTVIPVSATVSEPEVPTPQPPLVTATAPVATPQELERDQRKAQEEVRRLLREARELYAQGKLNDVERVLRTAIDRAPNAPRAYHLLGTLYLEQRDEERAFRLVSSAAHKFPNDAALHYDLGFMYANRGLSDMARDELTWALDLQPGGVMADRARLYLADGVLAGASRPSSDEPAGGSAQAGVVPFEEEGPDAPAETGLTESEMMATETPQ